MGRTSCGGAASVTTGGRGSWRCSILVSATSTTGSGASIVEKAAAAAATACGGSPVGNDAVVLHLESVGLRVLSQKAVVVGLP